jgi:hypothetical protein
MTDDDFIEAAIKAALREAAKAMRAAMVEIDGAGGVCAAAGGYIDTSSMDDDAVAAAGVAAFFRTLPREAPAGDERWFQEWWATDACDALAEDIECAAKAAEAGDT